ncbi:MAG TPA: DinB family protein, partial [Actinomycetota bacterium]|nr:DinB family protein [Actinomycetota bacterium]
MTSPEDVLRSMFEHHLWATETLIDHLDRLPAEQLDASVPGTYGSMIATLTHMIDADTRYLLRLRDPAPPPPEDRVGIGLAQLRSEIPEHRRRWDEALTDLEAGALHASILGREDYPDTDPAESMLLIQAIHHG